MRIVPLLTAVLLFAASTTALAQTAAAAQDDATGVAGHFQVRLRGVAVMPDASATIKVSGVDIGGKTDVTNSFIPEIDGTYFVTDHVGVEVIAGITKHSVHNSVVGDVASVWLLPPTVTVQYHFSPDAAMFRPYVGAGINYTFFYNAKSALPDISFSNNFGWALQAGVDVPVGDGSYFFNVDVKKLILSTTVKAAAGTVRATANLDPWLIGAGVGVRF